MAKPSNILISTIKRNQRFRGPASSVDQNSFQEEVIRDFTAIQQQYNSFIVPLTKTLPDGSIDVNAFQNGLDGRTIYAHAEAVNAGADVRYYNSLKGRPNTIYEQFLDTYAYIDSAIEALERDLITSNTNSVLTTQQEILQYVDTKSNELSISTAFRRKEITVSGLTQASGHLVQHNLGMYPQVQFINLGAGGHIEPISQTSGVWVQHTNNNSLTVYNYTGATVNEGLILLTW